MLKLLLVWSVASETELESVPDRIAWNVCTRFRHFSSIRTNGCNRNFEISDRNGRIPVGIKQRTALKIRCRLIRKGEPHPLPLPSNTHKLDVTLAISNIPSELYRHEAAGFC
jgi:hypothetical protein